MMTARQLLEELIKLTPEELDSEVKVGAVGLTFYPNSVKLKGNLLEIVFDSDKESFFIADHECPKWYTEADEHDLKAHKKHLVDKCIKKCMKDNDETLKRLAEVEDDDLL